MIITRKILRQQHRQKQMVKKDLYVQFVVIFMKAVRFQKIIYVLYANMGQRHLSHYKLIHAGLVFLTKQKILINLY